jgi:hypothetical protein
MDDAQMNWRRKCHFQNPQTQEPTNMAKFSQTGANQQHVTVLLLFVLPVKSLCRNSVTDVSGIPDYLSMYALPTICYDDVICLRLCGYGATSGKFHGFLIAQRNLVGAKRGLARRPSALGRSTSRADDL